MRGLALKLIPLALGLSVQFTMGCAYRTPVAPGEIPLSEPASPEDEEYGQQVLSMLTQSYPLERDDSSINRVRDVVDRLASAAGAAQTPWNVFVLQGDDVVNAAATKGNYVFVWTGMLRKVETDGELAAVLAHEMGHVLAGHTHRTPGEEAGRIMAEVTGQVTGRVVAAQGPYGALGQLAGMLAEEAVKALIVNPESHRQEFEADHIGIFLMADARYPPDQAISLWRKMSEETQSSAGLLNFLSSHPATDERLEELKGLLPAATERYRVALSLADTGGVRNHNDGFAVNSKHARAERLRWKALEDGTQIFARPSTRSPVVGVLKKDELVGAGPQRGEFLELRAPRRGFALTAELYSSPAD